MKNPKHRDAKHQNAQRQDSPTSDAQTQHSQAQDLLTKIPTGCAEATFAGGCFWCMEAVFDVQDGVRATISGYTGGVTANPSYRQVCSGESGHVEALRVIFEPPKISYAKLLDLFWHNVDPRRDDGQFCDTGPQYRPIIFVHDSEQKRQAERSRHQIEESGVLNGAAVLVTIAEVMPFYPAEEEHQDYYRKNPLRYALYHQGCGRERRLREIWGR